MRFMPGPARALWWRVRDSLWLIPALLVAIATLLAAGLVELDSLHSIDLARRWPRLFGAGADGSRGLLTAIATTMLTVAGTMFSITLAVLSLAASQYSPRVLRSFISDRPTQLVLGYFVAVFVYCLVVLRTIQGGDDGFVPSLAVLTGIVLAFVAVAALVFFIHRLSSSIQPSAILERIGAGTAAAIANLFPGEMGAEAAEEVVPEAFGAGPWTAVAALRTGYVVSVENEALLAFARSQGRLLRMDLGVGDFAIAGQALASLQGGAPVGEKARAALDRCYAFDRQRSLEQDVAFGLQQIADVALRALSPGINDQTTAVMCIDRLTVLFAQLARRRIETPLRRDEEALRVIARGPSFAGLLQAVLPDLAENAAGRFPVLARLLDALERVGRETRHAERRAALRCQLQSMAECVRRTVAVPDARDALLARVARLSAGYADPAPRSLPSRPRAADPPA